MTHFTCTCGNALFFENSRCLQCRREVGYATSGDCMVVLGGEGGWARCQNGTRYAACNWAVRGGPSLCGACQFTRVVPDLTISSNLLAWRKIEAAKRRVLQTLGRMGLFPRTKVESFDGLAFDFLAPFAGQAVMTGHADGVITMNVYEADDAFRENQRNALREPYRTLIGHFRHELGHYYWDQFFRRAPHDDPDLAAFRELFGDERADYAACLERHYQAGVVVANPAEYITSYARVHPWEDWAETWAQYLHLTDALETVRAFGWLSEKVPLPYTPLTAAAVFKGASTGDEAFLQDVNDWAKITPALNEVAASLGHGNLYPFVLSARTVRKMAFVHDVARKHVAGTAAKAA